MLLASGTTAMLIARDASRNEEITLLPTDIPADTTADEWAVIDFGAATMAEMREIPKTLWIHTTPAQMEQIILNAQVGSRSVSSLDLPLSTFEILSKRMSEIPVTPELMRAVGPSGWINLNPAGVLLTNEPITFEQFVQMTQIRPAEIPRPFHYEEEVGKALALRGTERFEQIAGIFDLLSRDRHAVESNLRINQLLPFFRLQRSQSLPMIPQSPASMPVPRQPASNLEISPPVASTLNNQPVAASLQSPRQFAINTPLNPNMFPVANETSAASVQSPRQPAATPKESNASPQVVSGERAAPKERAIRIERTTERAFERIPRARRPLYNVNVERATAPISNIPETRRTQRSNLAWRFEEEPDSTVQQSSLGRIERIPSNNKSRRPNQGSIERFSTTATMAKSGSNVNNMQEAASNIVRILADEVIGGVSSSNPKTDADPILNLFRSAQTPKKATNTVSTPEQRQQDRSTAAETVTRQSPRRPAAPARNLEDANTVLLKDADSVINQFRGLSADVTKILRTLLKVIFEKVEDRLQNEIIDKVAQELGKRQRPSDNAVSETSALRTILKRNASSNPPAPKRRRPVEEVSVDEDDDDEEAYIVVPRTSALSSLLRSSGRGQVERPKKPKSLRNLASRSEQRQPRTNRRQQEEQQEDLPTSRLSMLMARQSRQVAEDTAIIEDVMDDDY